ncbi:MAG: SH3 domain-containing protein [Bacillus sp. (in: firmicutes)]
MLLKKIFALFVSILVLCSVFHVNEVAEAASKTKYVKASVLNVRSAPSTSAKIVTQVKKNSAVTVTQTRGSWDKVKVGSKAGWVSNQYLTTKNPAVAQSSAKTMYVIASTLNVRSGAGTNYKVVTTVKKNSSVKVHKTSGAWSQVTAGTQKGWVSSKYLTSKKPAASKNLAQGLKTVGANKQLILVTANGYNTSTAEIRTFEKDSKGNWKPVLTVKGHIGKNGFATQQNMKEGGKRSPIGKYTIGTAFGRYANPGTKLNYRKITSDDVWVDDPTSKLYNTWQSKKKTQGQWKSAENMNVLPYNYGFVINYNMSRTPYKGSAIFFHVGNGYTLGCTATSEANVKSILNWLDPNQKPVIIQTPINELNKY